MSQPNPSHPYDDLYEEHRRQKKALRAIRKAMESHTFAVRLLGTDPSFHNTIFAGLGQPCPWCLIDTIIADALKPVMKTPDRRSAHV